MKRSLTGMREFTRENTLDPFPFRHGFHGYNLRGLRADWTAGLNVALLSVAQGMAVATIAGLDVQYGIVSGAIAAVVAPFFSGSRHTILGPSNATAFLLFAQIAAFSAAERIFYLPMIVLFTGVILLIGALFRAGEFVQYVSRPVIVGYISGAAVLIIINQLDSILGYQRSALDDEGPKTFFTILLSTFDGINQTTWKTPLLSVATFGLWLFMTLRFRKLPVFAIVLVAMSGVYFLLNRYAGWELATFSEFSLKELSPHLPKTGPGGFFSDVGRLIGISFSLAFLSALENSVMSKALASQVGDRADVNQDMFGAGIANISASFAVGMPVSGSLTRSALNFSSGAVSRLSSLFSGLICFALLPIISKAVIFVPRCVLAALIVGVSFFVINRRYIRISLAATPGDAAVLTTTFIASLLLPLNVAIFLGVGISILLYLRAASRPYLVEYEFSEEGNLREAGEKRARPIPAISIVHVEGDIFFGAAELFRTQIQKAFLDPDLKVIILRLKNARHLDATAVIAMEEMLKFLRENQRYVIISGATKDVYRVLKKAGTVEVIGRDNIFLSHPRNPNLSTRNALKRAQELLGTKKADIRIFYDPTKEKK